jgi:hypothetical protein
MPLITQVLWGALFCIPFGFSFTALRCSTLSIALVGVLGTYLLLKQVKVPRYLSFTAALIVASNPIYFALSNTFMTDVPFTAFTVLALVFFMRCIQVESDMSLAVGTFFAGTAILCRQLGLFLPIAFIPAYIMKKGISLSTLFRAGLPTIVGLGALIGFETWLQISAGLPAAYTSHPAFLLRNLGNVKAILRSIPMNMVTMTVYLGLFLLPFMLLLPKPFRVMKNRGMLYSSIIFILFAIAAVYVMFVKGRIMPLGINILTNGGIGPVTLHDVRILRLPHVPTLPPFFWMLITVMSIAGGGFLLVTIFFAVLSMFAYYSGDLTSDNDRINRVFLLSACVIYCLPMAIFGFRDRYILPLLALLCTFIAVSVKTLRFHGRPLFVTLVLLSICLCFLVSIATTRDYLAWNRTRWQALRTLVENDRILPSEIDGGFEFNGWYLYDPKYSRNSRKSWWWVHDDYYMITMGPVNGYEIIRYYRFHRWMPPQKSSILILRRKNR